MTRFYSVDCRTTVFAGLAIILIHLSTEFIVPPFRSPDVELSTSVSHDLQARARALRAGHVAIVLVGPGGRRALWNHYDESNTSPAPIGDDRWFSLGSVGKHVTAAAVLSLVDEGRVDVGSAIGDYLRELPAVWGRRSVDSLLRHTSGLPEYFEHVGEHGVPLDRAGFIARFGSVPPLFEADRTWMYSNTNYILLGLLIAECTGSSYAQVVQRRLFDKAGGRGLRVGGPDFARALNAAPVEDRIMESDAQIIGDGDVVATVVGAATWLEALVGDEVLSPAGKSASWRGTTLADGTVAPYGCGWFVDEVEGRPLHYHGGHFDGWSAFCAVAPGTRAGVMLMSDVAPGNTRAQRDLAIRALEAWAPGSTPLALRRSPDDDPALTAVARRQLLRESAGPDPQYLAESAKEMAEAGGRRALVNLWCGVPPSRFSFVDERAAGTGSIRRYRIDYPTRTEHVNVGYDRCGRIYWAWPV